MKTPTRVSLFIVLLCCSAAVFVAIHRMRAAVTAVAAATIMVQDNGDGPANAENCPGAGCRLRDALAAAANGDTIDFNLPANSTITLGSEGNLLVDKSITISGPGANTLVVSGNNATRVFYMAAGTTSVISGLTISGGTGGSGGGIFIDHATLTVNNCIVTGNSGSFGGGIFNEGQSTGSMVTINNSTISNNSAVSGGGLYNHSLGQGAGQATLIINNCTISGNTGTNGSSGGGAIYNNSEGKAVVIIKNSTFSGNSSPGFGGGILNEGIVTIGSTILKAGAQGANIVQLLCCGGGVTSLGYNLSSDDQSAVLNQPTDQNSTDPMLDPAGPQDNGGPTFTIALQPGSPAIDKGKNFSGSPNDQRGFPRTFDDPGIMNASGGDGTDIGAFEVAAAATTITVQSNGDDGTANAMNCPGAGCRLRDALAAAKNGDTINFNLPPNTTIQLGGGASGQLFVDKSITISGPGAFLLTVRGTGFSRVFGVTGGTTVIISGLTVTNGVGNGAIVNDQSTLTVSACNITGNFTDGLGGGIYNFGNGGSATLTVNNSTISGNSAFDGGGIYNNGASSGHAILTINNSTISGNSASNTGGIFNNGNGGSATLTVTNSTISGNSGNVGGLFNSAMSSGSATATIGSTIFKAGDSGANIANSSGTVSSKGYNLSSDDASAFLNQSTDQNSTDPLLDPNGLQNNGGLTPTIGLQPGSPAVDKGKNFSGSPNDQRGPAFARTVDEPIMNASGGNGTDIGAFEGIVCPQVLTATVNDSVTGTGLNQFDYTSGGWSYYNASNFFTAYQKDEHYAPTAGTKAHFRFHGNQVKIYTVKEPAGGFIHYTLDGGTLDNQLVDNYSAVQTGNTLSYTSPIVPVGDHDLLIEVNGTHGAGSSNTITVDKAEVYDAICAPPTPVQALAATINDNDTGTGNNQFDYTSGGWSYYTNNNFTTAFQKDEHYAFTTGVFALFRFSGTQVKIYTVKEPAGGNIRYTLDGGTDVQVIDNYSPTQMGNSLSYTSPVVSSGNHVLKIEVLGTHNMGSSNTITIDKAEVYVSSIGPSLTATINDNTTGNGNNQFDYSSGGWSYYSNPSFTTAFQMDEHYAFGTGVLAHFRFNGTQVKIYTVKEPVGGRIRYVLDTNVDIQTISNYSPTQVGNSLSYTSPVVPAGNHDLIIQVDGTHEPSATSNTITVDKAEVFNGP